MNRLAHSLRRSFSVLTLLALAISSLRVSAADTVTLTNENGVTESRTGEIVDYTGETLTLRLPDGRDSTIPSQNVRGIEISRLPEHVHGDALLAEGKFAEALAQYRLAGKEPRRWVQRELLARMSQAYLETGNIEKAGASFLVLLKSDPKTLHFAAVPLAWRASEPPPGLLKQAQGWMATKDAPAAQLIGASWLLVTEQRTDALAVLKKLTENEDRRVARLAEAQIWRTRFIAATPNDIERWRKTIADTPRELRAGPYFMLGQAEARAKLPEAAITLLRVPVLYDSQRSLATEALFAAGQVLADEDQLPEAYRVYAELAGGYPQSPLAEEAQARCNSLRTKTPELQRDEPARNATLPPPHDFPADEADAALFAAFIDRRLARLAQGLCAANIRSAGGNEGTRDPWVIRSIEAETAIAFDAPPAEREGRWKNAQAGALFLMPFDVRGGNAIIARLELAGVHLARGEQLVYEAKLLAGDEKRFEPARAPLQEAHKRLDEAADDLKHLEMIAAEKSIMGEYRERLNAWQRLIARAQARALRIEASTLPAGGARIDKLAEAQKTLEPLLATELNDISSWEVRLEALACMRALEKFDSARQLRAVLAEKNPSPEMATRLRAELVRIELASGRLDMAREIARDEKPAPYTLPTEAEAELDFARLEVLVAQREEAKKAGRTDDADALSKEALESATHILWRYGAGWGRRASLLVAK